MTDTLGRLAFKMANHYNMLWTRWSKPEMTGCVPNSAMC